VGNGITCFGKELELPNLQAYLLDSHWKQVEKMKIRLTRYDSEKQLEKVSDADLYSDLMICLAVSLEQPHIISSDEPKFFTRDVPFVLEDVEASQQKKYNNFLMPTDPLEAPNLSSSIKQKVKKVLPDTSSGATPNTRASLGNASSSTLQRYESLGDYHCSTLKTR